MVATMEEYVFACKVEALPARGKKTIILNGKRILIVTCDQGIYAIEDKCPQTGGRMALGKVLDCSITSPNNGARYSLETGQYIDSGVSPLQSHWLTVFPVKIVDGDVRVLLGNL